MRLYDLNFDALLRYPFLLGMRLHILLLMNFFLFRFLPIQVQSRLLKLLPGMMQILLVLCHPQFLQELFNPVP